MQVRISPENVSKMKELAGLYKKIAPGYAIPSDSSFANSLMGATLNSEIRRTKKKLK